MLIHIRLYFVFGGGFSISFWLKHKWLYLTSFKTLMEHLLPTYYPLWTVCLHWSLFCMYIVCTIVITINGQELGTNPEPTTKPNISPCIYLILPSTFLCPIYIVRFWVVLGKRWQLWNNCGLFLVMAPKLWSYVRLWERFKDGCCYGLETRDSLRSFFWKCQKFRITISQCVCCDDQRLLTSQ